MILMWSKPIENFVSTSKYLLSSCKVGLIVEGLLKGAMGII